MYELGDVVTIISDNENYNEYKEMDLTITHIATSTQQHPGYDDSMEGMQLLDLETEEMDDVPFSLYEYEVE